MYKSIIFFILITVLPLESHEFNPAHLIVDQSDNDKNLYQATWMYPVKNIGKRANVIFPNICILDAADPYVQGKYVIEKISLECSDTIKGKSIEIINLSVLTDALITINFVKDTFEGLVNVQNNKIEIPLK